MRYFRLLTAEADEGVTERVTEIPAELIKRGAFTLIGIIMLLWSWTLLAPQFSAFPNIDVVATLLGLFTVILGIRNALSIVKDVTTGQIFITVAFVAAMIYFIWFI